MRQEIEERCGRTVAIGAVYATLSRLADKGCVSFRISDPLPVPGGRSKTRAADARGRRALAHATVMLQRILPDFAARGARTGGDR